MQTLKFQNREEWLAARRGKITGSRLKDIVVKRGNGKKIGFYELIAERLGVPADDESPMDRGTRLESEAMAKYIEVTGEKIDTSLVIWTRDDDESIAISPDGFKGKTKAVEVKCLASARHIEAYLTKQIPDEYEFQKLQYFIVNDKLKELDFVFYDPRILPIPFFTITIKREDVQKEIDEYLEYQRNILKEVNQIVNDLTF
jgi:putative phage-type endonuclease